MVQSVSAQLPKLYRLLLASYGRQYWWPADTPFEVMVGAVLTQNTNWSNVEKAIANLKSEGLMDARRILEYTPERLADVIRPAGFFRQKAARLTALCRFYLEHGGNRRLRGWQTGALRERLLAIHGIGPETADSILLYALHKPVFVIDAYTIRIFSRLGILDAGIRYADAQDFFHDRLPRNTPLFQEFHALIVAHAKHHCRSRPLCDGCPLAHGCACATSGR